jgi:hypothetical protein
VARRAGGRLHALLQCLSRRCEPCRSPAGMSQRPPAPTCPPPPHLLVQRRRLLVAVGVSVELGQQVEGAGDVQVVGREALAGLCHDLLELGLGIVKPGGREVGGVGVGRKGMRAAFKTPRAPARRRPKPRAAPPPLPCAAPCLPSLPPWTPSGAAPPRVVRLHAQLARERHRRGVLVGDGVVVQRVVGQPALVERRGRAAQRRRRRAGGRGRGRRRRLRGGGGGGRGRAQRLRLDARAPVAYARCARARARRALPLPRLDRHSPFPARHRSRARGAPTPPAPPRRAP